MDPRDARVAAFGRWLLQERELRDLSRQEVARLTRLAPGVVEALESGEAGRMPPRAYLLGYLRSYATAVGLDPDDLVLRWQEADGQAVEAGPSPRRRIPPRRVALAALALLLLGALVAYALWPRKRALELQHPPRQMERAPYQPR
ncbi:MAG: helix-turn-helix domain-containing protein [Deltaproteobacteria bacterium]|nr:helix-turn-helix domain-containing protein [Deltaproteobacteria bacterium]